MRRIVGEKLAAVGPCLGVDHALLTDKRAQFLNKVGVNQHLINTCDRTARPSAVQSTSYRSASRVAP